MGSLTLGMARARLGPAAALIDPQRGALAACEENRLTRARYGGHAGPPELATRELLRYLGRTSQEIGKVAAVTEHDGTAWTRASEAVAVDGHPAHAAYAFHAAAVTDALVLVCEFHRQRGWTAWRFRSNGSPREVGDGLGDFPLARVYGQLTEALGLQATRDEHLVEAMARAGRDIESGLAALVEVTPERLTARPELISEVAAAAQSPEARQNVATTVQRRLGEGLTELLRSLSRLEPDARTLCLSGGLFFNTFFTTTAAGCDAFDYVSVPPHPGRNGGAIGAALIAGGAGSARSQVPSPHLGPAYSDAEIKEALDNCKLSYDLLREDRLMDDILHALSRGRLAGWFHGRLEWGPRALGHRSVLVDPFGQHTLDNLNGFLKQRPAYRSYGVSVPLARVSEFFEGPPASPFMQFEYRPRDREKFRTILPSGVDTLRVHTVDESEPRFLRLLDLWGEKTGVPVLVNTSFNGFHEPLVCSPRDAIRVFYGTGLDVLALENFYLRK